MTPEEIAKLLVAQPFDDWCRPHNKAREDAFCLKCVAQAIRDAVANERDRCTSVAIKAVADLVTNHGADDFNELKEMIESIRKPNEP